MNTDELIRMANQIGRFYASYPPVEAREGIATHLELFWEPRMREQLRAHLEGGGAGLSALLKSALECCKPIAES